jgi:hypothetical protein
MNQRILRPTLAILLVPLATAPVWAQEPPPPGGESAPSEGLEPATDPSVGEDPGEEGDRPNDPDALTTRDEDGGDVKAKARPTKATYPIEIIHRPMTLAQNQAEISLDVPIVFGGGGYATQVLRGAFGVTQDLQVGVSYGFGLERFSTEGDEKSYEPGKAASIDGAYTIVPDHLAVTASIPLYFSPFAAAITIGAPFRVRLGKKLALVGGNDLVQIGLGKWPVTVADPAYNLLNVQGDELVGREFDRANININFGAQVQMKPNLVLQGLMGVHFIDLSDADEPISLHVGATWSKDKSLDVGARIGWNALDDNDSFGMGLFAAYRL